MGFIPKDARWYLADIVLELIIEGEPRNVVHVNTHLVEAESPEQAHEKALALGRAGERSYANTDGKQVRVVFCGLQELCVIHDALEDGVELMYSETVGVTEEELRKRVTPKERLGVFAPIERPRAVPNYMPESIMRELESVGFHRDDLVRGERFSEDMATIQSILAEQVATIRTRRIVGFVRGLVHDLRANPDEWENPTLETYLEALASWVEDSEGYSRNRGKAVPPEPSWKVVGEILMAARSYE